MNANDDAWQAFFDRECDWLKDLPGLRPGPGTYCRFGQILEDWLDEYYRAVCRKEPPADPTVRDPYLRRLWGCWAYHLRKLAETQGTPKDDGPTASEFLARQLQAGQDGNSRALGGNPLRDLVLAEAVVREERAAVQQFEEQFRADVLDTLAGILGKDVRDYPDLWWQHATAFLRSAFPTFRGACGLQGWLKTVVGNFARKFKDPPDPFHRQTDPRTPPDPDEHDDKDTRSETDRLPGPDKPQESVEERLERNECRELLEEYLPTAIQQLSDEDRLILLLRYVEKLTFWQIEQLVLRDQEHEEPTGVKTPTSSKRKTAEKPGGHAHHRTVKALRELRSILLRIGEQTGRKNAVRDCLESAAEGGHQDSLLHLLEDALRQDGDKPRIDPGTKDDRKENER